jgi:hypothetical protein
MSISYLAEIIMVPTDLLYRELLLQRKPTVSSVTTNTLCG